MVVDVRGDADRGVAEHLRYDSDRDSGRDHQRRGAVPEIMQPHLTQPRGLAQGDEPAGDVLRPQWCTVLPGEHQVVILVRIAPRGAVEFLAQAHLSEGVHRALGHGDGGLGRPCLWGVEPQSATDVDDGLPDPCRPVAQVQVAPAEPERLAAAQSARGDHLEKRAETVGLHVPKEGRELAGGPGLHLGPGAVRRSDVTGDVVGESSRLHPVGQRRPEGRVDAPDGLRPAPDSGVVEQLLDVLGAQPLDRQVPDRRDDDVLHVRPI
nr:hypothetical protein [Blastococcus mobilis]